MGYVYTNSLVSIPPFFMKSNIRVAVLECPSLRQDIW